ncbi:MFS transporter [Paraburkholderia sp. J67]|uniref:MFS transporter n=1 Tax=Paraburkholderia sp. J67 TaxID=2805435 RepID=UPI002ABD9341|nr:MFS transporter [Paraburkholderia sp. J67]
MGNQPNREGASEAVALPLISSGEACTNQATGDAGRFYGWINVSMAGLVLMISMGVEFSFQIFLPILCKEFAWSSALVGGAVSLSMLLLGLTSPLSGAITARYGCKMAIIAGHVLLAIGLLVLSFQTQPWHLYAGLSLMGAGCGIGGMVPAMTLASNWFFRKRSLAMSLINSSISIGGFVMIPFTTALVAHSGWRSSLLVLCAVVTVFTAVIPGILIRNKPEDVGHVPDGATDSIAQAKAKQRETSLPTLYNTPVDFTLKQASKTWALWMLIIVYGAVQYTITMLMTYQISFLQSLGIEGMVAGSAAGLQSGVGLIGALAIGFLGFRFNMRTLIIICMALLTAGMGLTLTAQTVPMVFLYNVVLGLGIGAFTTSIMAIFAAWYGRSHFPKILGLTTPFWMLMGSSGAGVSGALYDATGGFMTPFLVATVALALSLALICCTKPPKHPSLA